MTDIWKDLDLERWTWELPRDTPGPYVAQHIPKPLIVDWVKIWRPVIDEALEKAEKYDDMKPIWDRATDELMRSTYNLQQTQKKLEDIKTWRKNMNVWYNDIDYLLAALDEILSSEFTTKGDNDE